MGALGSRSAGRLGWLLVAVAASSLVLFAGITGHLSGGRTDAAGLSGGISDPIALLGAPLPAVTCPTAPMAVGRDRMAVCPDWTAIVDPAGTVQVVSLFGPGNSAVDARAGALPEGLHWSDGLAAVWAQLGRPRHITAAFGTPMLVYWFSGRPYQSLELRFDSAERLVQVNASTLR